MNKTTGHIHFIAMLIVTLGLAACGGGGGGGGDGTNNSGDEGNSSGAIIFEGGSLADLKAIKPDLNFDTLEINGSLGLPFYSSAKITAKNLTITPKGSIGYKYSTCEYNDAPSIALNVANDVVIDGVIRLRGRSGTTVSSGASCNSCYGQDGGDVSIVAGGNITVSSSILNYGGGGASIHYIGSPSSPCSAGASGNLTLEAKGNMTLDNATIDNRAGHNFNNAYATSGKTNINTGNHFIMNGGSIDTTGVLNFSANLATISGIIDYGSLNESLAGAKDTSPPILTIISPTAGTILDWHQPFQIQIQASDDGMGLHDIQVTGFGHDQRHYESEFVNGELRIDIAEADEPTSLDVVVTDNKRLQTSASVANLSIAYPQEIEPNDSLAQAQVIDSGRIVDGNIKTGDAGYANSAIQNYLKNLGDPGWNTRLAEDVYTITLPPSATRINVKLNFTNNPDMPDIDLYLLSSGGNTVLDASTGDNQSTGNYTESINYSGATGGATYYLLLQAYNVSSRANYRLTRY